MMIGTEATFDTKQDKKIILMSLLASLFNIMMQE